MFVRYGVDPHTHLIDFAQVRALAQEHRPKLLWCGATTYPRTVHFDHFAEIAREVGRAARRRYRPYLRARCWQCAPFTGATGRRRYHHHAQNVAWAARAA